MENNIMGETRSEELEYLDWTRKLAERLAVVHTCIIDRRKIMDSDYDVMEELYRVFDRGAIPFYHRVAEGTDDVAEQSSLFGQNV